MRKPAFTYAKADEAKQTGANAEALALVQSGFSAWQYKPASVWHWRFRLFLAELVASRNDEKQASLLLHDELPPQIPDHARLQARLISDRGYLAYVRRNYPEAQRLAGQAVELALQSSIGDLLPQILLTQGYAYVMDGQFGPAEEAFRASIEAAKRAGDEYMLASARGSLGFFFVRAHRYDEAISACQSALELSTPGGYAQISLRAYSNLGWSYYRLGNFAKAERYLAGAQTNASQLNNGVELQRALGNIGSVRFSQQDYQGAISYYKQALQVNERFPADPGQQALWLNNIATTYLEIGDVSSAEECNRQALELQAKARDSVVGVLPRLNQAQIALRKSDFDSASRIYNEVLQSEGADSDTRWETHHGLAELYARRGDFEHARKEYEEAIAILDENWSSLLNNDSKFTFPSRLSRFYRSYVDFLMERDRKQEALDFAESRRARVLSQDLDLKPQNGDFRALARQSNRVLLSYWLAPQHSYLWVTTPTGFERFPLRGEEEIKPLVESYSESIQRKTDSDAGSKLYNLLIKPAETFIPEGAHVVVVPDGCLHGLNFETLRTPSGRFWIEDATIEVTPSLTLLSLDRTPPGHNRSILLMGDPIPSDKSLPGLPAAGPEIAEISAIYRDADPIVKTRQDALPETYLGIHPDTFGAIHFAAHAVPNRDSPLDSAVVLSPGKDSAKLYARQVLNAPLTADLVTISSCQSAGARTYDGEGLVGFAWAFLKAGAHHVVASLWDVNDQYTADFMTRFYARIHDGQRPAEALRDVKLEYLQADRFKRLPYHWAPFQLYVR